MISRAATLAWLVVLAVAVLWVAARAWQAPVISADLLAMLPKPSQPSGVARWSETYRKTAERQVAFLIGAPSRDLAERASLLAYQDLKASRQFEELTLRHDAQAAGDVVEFYVPRRFGLLTDRTRERLGSGQDDLVLRAIIRAYFDPASALVSNVIEVDPFLFLSRYMADLGGSSGGEVSVENGLVTVRAEGTVYILISGTLADSPFSFALQDRLRPVLAALGTAGAGYPDGVSVLRSGAIFHAVAGRDSARGEISTVGLGALAGIVLLYLVVFRSFRPLVLSLLSIAVGCLGGFAACVIAFGQIHLLTLVFGATLVGISVDYSLHYFCARFHPRSHGGPAAAIRRVLPGMTLGLLTSAAGFAGLLLLGFPGLQQVGLFSGVGLLCAYLFVLTVSPRLDAAAGVSPPTRLLAWADGYLDRAARRRSAYVGAAAIVLAVGVSGMLKLHAVDDIRQLQSADPSVLAEDRSVRDRLGQDVASQFFLVTAADSGQLLAREEHLAALLKQAETDGTISGHMAFAAFVPSPARRAENYALLGDFLRDRRPELERVAGEVGLPDALLDRYRVDFAAGDGADDADALAAWLETPMARPYRALWLGRSGDQVAAVVGLSGVRDPRALAGLQERVDGVTFVDRVDDLSRLFAELREAAQVLILAACAVIAMVVVFRYGPTGGAAVITAPVTAVVASLGLQGWLGEPQSIFNVMALLLVLGIGVDFGIFVREAGREAGSTLLAVALSAVTSILAFGLLGLSSTAGVHGFGLTVFIGVVVAFLLCPLATTGRSPDTAPPHPGAS
ncbi:MAG: MMPL family transporter [Thalassobaculaceae bacterium]|nr:MMPL family transporter [Thalassobaculaceae bacterium]